VEAYHAMRLPKGADPAVPTPALFPLLEAIRAGKRAASMKVIDTRERGFPSLQLRCCPSVRFDLQLFHHRFGQGDLLFKGP
jgi:hypothetical protein